MLTEAQEKDLIGYQSFKHMTEEWAWARVVEYLDALVEEAQNDTLGCLDERELANYARRWQQRVAVVSEIKNFVNNWLSVRESINEELELANVNEPDSSAE